MHHKGFSKKNLYALMITLCISTSLQIYPFYLCYNNKKIHDEVVDPSLKNNDLNNDSITVSKSLTQDDYSECVLRRKPNEHTQFRCVVNRPPNIGMVAIGIPRYHNEDDNISE